MKSFSIENNFLRAVFLSYGAILHELWVKTSEGKEVNIIQGLPNREDYLTDEWARGAVIGRFAGRLENPIQIKIGMIGEVYMGCCSGNSRIIDF